MVSKADATGDGVDGAEGDGGGGAVDGGAGAAGGVPMGSRGRGRCVGVGVLIEGKD